MDSTTRTITHNFTFAGTIDELVNLVRDWRALLPGDDDRDGRLHYLSRSYLTNQPGWEMGSHNPDTFTTRRLSEHERVHLGKVKPVEDGGAIRRVTLDVSLIRWEEKEEAWSLAGKPASMHWRYHRGEFGEVALGFRHERGAIVGKLQFPDVVKEECTELLTMLSMWKPDQTTQAGETPDNAALVPKRQDIADRVTRAHKLLKDGITASAVFRNLIHIEKNTYRKYCRGVTGEEPLV